MIGNKNKTIETIIKYNIIQIEDSKALSSLAENIFTGLGLNYVNFENYSDFHYNYHNKGIKAEIYIIDGNFPRSIESKVETTFLFPETVKTIRKKEENPTIIFYSNMVNIEEIARDNNTLFVDKMTPNSPLELYKLLILSKLINVDENNKIYKYIMKF